MASFADKFYKAVESLPTPVRETIQTNYTITEICGSGAGTTRKVIYSENPPICSDDAGIATCHIDGKVVSGILKSDSIRKHW